MSSSTPSDISQNDAKVLEKQWQEIQWRHKEEQQLLAQLEEAVKLHWAKRAAQKARREVEAERQRVTEEEERKKRTMEYLQQLQDEMLEEKAVLLEGAEESQVMRSKCKEVTARDKEMQRLSKKAREKQPGKYCRSATVKMGDSNPCKRYVCAKQDCLVHPSR